MELDRTLIDKDGTPSTEELKEYFRRNDYREPLKIPEDIE